VLRPVGEIVRKCPALLSGSPNPVVRRPGRDRRAIWGRRNWEMVKTVLFSMVVGIFHVERKQRQNDIY